MKALIAIALLAAAGYYFFMNSPGSLPSSPIGDQGKANTMDKRVEGVQVMTGVAPAE
ncbi:MAG: hypothetical protein HYV07_11195 [Deltaproteobacteria bacterium]|nr:hypothetical protein [Deltaproteobacteria bacterium]